MAMCSDIDPAVALAELQERLFAMNTETLDKPTLAEYAAFASDALALLSRLVEERAENTRLREQVETAIRETRKKVEAVNAERDALREQLAQAKREQDSSARLVAEAWAEKARLEARFTLRNQLQPAADALREQLADALQAANAECHRSAQLESQLAEAQRLAEQRLESMNQDGMDINRLMDECEASEDERERLADQLAAMTAERDRQHADFLMAAGEWRTAEAERDELRAALIGVKRRFGCWCSAGGDRLADHMPSCIAAEKALAALRPKGEQES